MRRERHPRQFEGSGASLRQVDGDLLSVAFVIVDPVGTRAPVVEEEEEEVEEPVLQHDISGVPCDAAVVRVVAVVRPFTVEEGGGRFRSTRSSSTSEQRQPSGGVDEPGHHPDSTEAGLRTKAGPVASQLPPDEIGVAQGFGDEPQGVRRGVTARQRYKPVEVERAGSSDEFAGRWASALPQSQMP